MTLANDRSRSLETVTGYLNPYGEGTMWHRKYLSRPVKQGYSFGIYHQARRSVRELIKFRPHNDRQYCVVKLYRDDHLPEKCSNEILRWCHIYY